MCGIIGIVGHPQAKQQVEKALALLQNRGKDGQGIVEISPSCALGHTLHAVVGHCPQPLQGKGTLVANCEIYNWRELARQHNSKAENDAQLLLEVFDTRGVCFDDLDGVFALAYYHDGILTLARDILGEKPLWYTLNSTGMAFASEKKVLRALGYEGIKELNPRQVLLYDCSSHTLRFITRPFFTILPEHQDDFSSLQETTALLLENAIAKRLPKKKFGLLFSGGIDSTYLARYFQMQGADVTCYTAVLDSTTIPADLKAAQEVAQHLGLALKIRKIALEEIPSYLQKIIPLIEDSNVVKVGVALTLYAACELARQDGCKVIFSGLGSEEIFAGYERHKNSANVNQECLSGLLKMYERDLYRDDVVTMDNSLELRLPFLDKELVRYALKIPGRYKLHAGITKYILRTIALQRGLPEAFAFRKKVAAQYGSRLDAALGILARRNKFPSKSSYLRTFYPSSNLRLGVLFSSGKDSTMAAYLMRQQNYHLACLITLRSANEDSYMFQTAGTELVELQAQAMGLPLIVQKTEGRKEEELVELKHALQRAQELYGIEGVVCGALHSTYQRDRVENICDALGLKIFSPLWHKGQREHMNELLHHGFKAVITKIAADGLNETWLGKEITPPMIAELEELHGKNKINIAFEGGEAETLVIDCPLFAQKIVLTTEKKMSSSCEGRLIIKEAHLEEK